MKTKLSKMGLLGLLIAGVGCLTGSAAPFTVTNTLDSGAGSLRAAITSANGTAGGTNLIQFNIPGTNVQTITPVTALPAITRPVIIDGYTQPGASPNTNSLANGFGGALQIELNGANTGVVGLRLLGGGGSTIRGLVINRCSRGVLISFSSNNVVEGCFVGVNPAGTSAQVNDLGIFVEFDGGNLSCFNRIGGTNAAARNLISGNNTGVFIQSGTNNVVQGNLIGTDATGTNGLANSIGVSLAASDTLVGGTNVAARNIIAGPGGFEGIFVGAVTGTRIQGNFIGTDATGSRALGLRYGITLDSTATATQIGGPTATPGTPPGNVVTSSSFEQAIQNSGNGNIIQGNLVCTDVTGRNPLGNARFGIGVYGAFNLISSNVISGSTGEAGLFAGNSAALVHDNLIQGNFIGPDITGTNLIGNAGNGIWVSLASSNTIQSNVIAGNHDQGVFIAPSTTAQAVLGNSIFANAGLGIFLGSGANNSQTNPVITSAATGLGNVSMGGSLKSGSNAVYHLEFFSNASCDGSGFGEGQVFLGATNLTTDANGNVSFIMILANPAGHANFTATATDTNGNTSAFSPCISVSGPCVLNCSTNIVVSTAPNQCGAVVNFFPSTSGNCGAVNCSPVSGSFFPKGTNTVTCTSANGTNCGFTITVNDTQAPSITCPANITTNVPVSQSNAVVNFSAPVFADNCGLASTNVSPASGSVFPLGVTTVICTATDTSGNTNTCSFTVTVTHTNTPPVAQCQNVITNADGSCQAEVAASAVDNGSFDPDGTITNRFLTPGPYPKGTNTVALTVVDNLGGSNTCLANIIVLDTTLPTVICPANIVTNAPPGQTSMVVSYPAAITTDNCPGATNNTSIPASGSVFPLGTTTVTCSGTDASKNTNFCSFTVTVNATPIDRVWTNVLGGNYHTAANWQSNVIPSFLDSARFVSNATYQVSWTIDGTAANAFFDAASGTVTQAIGTKFWLLTNSYVIGPNSGSTATVALVSGTLRATNSARTGLFEVRRGTNRFNAGLMEVDRLLMTNTAGKFEFKGGTLITRGAAITNSSSFNVGTSNGTVAVWDVRAGTNVARSGLQIGRDATNALLLVTNGARLISFGGFVGFGSTARSNVAVVAGSSSVWESGNDFDFGGGGSFNQVIVSNGGAIFDSDAIIGNGGTNNTMFVVGTGSVWSNSASLALYGSFNQLIVSDGGNISSDSGIIDGSHNTVFINGAGSVWNNLDGAIYVGSSGSFNQLVVSNSAAVLASELDIGFESTSTNNRVVVSAGTLTVTNPVFNALLDIRGGTNQLSNGLIEANRLLVTNTLGVFEFNGGTLNIRSSTVSNSQAFFVGDGTNSATLNLVGNGTHSFANGLTIRSNGLLMGNGVISGTLTAQTGGIVNPAIAPSTPAALIVSGNLSLQSNSVLRVLLNGPTPGSAYSQLRVTNANLQMILNSPTLDLLPAFTPAIGDSFIIIDNQTGFGYGGPGFNGLPEGTIFTNAGFFFKISYSGGTGNDVTLTRVLPLPSPVPAIPISSGNYLQDFNSLSSSGFAINAWSNATTLPGWYASQSSSPFAITNYHSDSGGDVTGALYSYGAASSSERALGSIASGTSGTIGFGLCFTNDTTLSASNFVVTYTGEQWRNGSTSVTNTLTFWYRVSSSPLTNPEPSTATGWTPVTGLNFASPTVLTTGAGLDGNQATNRHTFSALPLPGLAVSPGQNVFFRWLDINDASNDDGMAVDDLAVSFSVGPQFTTTARSGAQLILSGGGGSRNGSYRVLTSTNVVLPFANWSALFNGRYDCLGNFSFTTSVDPDESQRFFALMDLLSAASNAVALVSDTWQDAERNQPGAVMYSENGFDADGDGDLESAWFSSPGNAMTVVTNRIFTTQSDVSSSYTTYFTPEQNPVTLANAGDQLKITWVFGFAFINATSTTQGFRLAVVDSPSTNRVTFDTSPQVGPYLGYAMFMNMRQGNLGNANSFQLRKRAAPGTPASFLVSSSDWISLTNGATTDTPGYTPGNLCTNIWTITRNASGGLDIVCTMAHTGLGGAGTNQLSVSCTDTAPDTFTFDTFGVRPSSKDDTAHAFEFLLFKAEFTCGAP